MKNFPLPFTPSGDLDLSPLRDAPRAAVPELDTAAIMAAVRAEAAAHPLVWHRPNPAAQTFSAIAAAIAIAWSAITLLHAPATADAHIQTAWLQNIDPSALEEALTSEGAVDAASYDLAALPPTAPAPRP